MNLTAEIELWTKEGPKFYGLTFNKYLRVTDLQARGIGKPDPLLVMEAGVEHGIIPTSDFVKQTAAEGSRRELLRQEFVRKHVEVLFDDPDHRVKELEDGATLQLLLIGSKLRPATKIVTFTFTVTKLTCVDAFDPWTDPFAHPDVTVITMSTAPKAALTA